MQVKVFESADMATGLRKVRKELGPDALILSTRTIRNGKLGLLGKSILEITAAVDDSNIPSFNGTGNQSAKTCTSKSAMNHAYIQNISSASPESVRSKSPEADNGMLSDIDELKNMVRSLAGEISLLKPAGITTQGVNCQGVDNDPTSSTCDLLTNILLNNGISLETASTIAGFARESLTFKEMSNPEILTDFLHDTITGLFQVSPPDFSGQTSPRKIALVGPTGVGKTTTLAKIAASYMNQYSGSVAFITIDTYRIAAVEQLKVYGEIMRLPVDVVISPAQLDDALEKYSDRDLILIDTAGRSPRDRVCIEELATFLKPELNIENHLVLSAVTRETELRDTITQFNNLGINKTIFTKIDECCNLGVLLNIQIGNSSPLSYLTNGQRVPEDLLEIDRETISRLVIPPIEGSAS